MPVLVGQLRNEHESSLRKGREMIVLHCVFAYCHYLLASLSSVWLLLTALEIQDDTNQCLLCL